MGCLTQLEINRFNFIPNVFTLNTLPSLLPRKLEVLIQQSADWKRVIQTLNDKVMPVHPDFKACCVSKTTPIPDPSFDEDAMEVKRELLETSAKASGVAHPNIAVDGLEFAPSTRDDPAVLAPSPSLVSSRSLVPVPPHPSSSVRPSPSPSAQQPDNNPVVLVPSSSPLVPLQPLIPDKSVDPIPPRSSSSVRPSPSLTAQQPGITSDSDAPVPLAAEKMDVGEQVTVQGNNDEDVDSLPPVGQHDTDEPSLPKPLGLADEMDVDEGEDEVEKESSDEDSDEEDEAPAKKHRKKTVASRLSHRSDIIGRLPRRAKKGKKGSSNEVEEEGAGDNLESDGEVTWRAVKGKGKQRVASQNKGDEGRATPQPRDSQTESKLQTEALAVLRPGTFTSSGLEVDEAQRVLGAVLGLSSEERAQFFGLSHEELLETFRKGLSKKSTGDRDDKEMRSPPHKKTRRHL